MDRDSKRREIATVTPSDQHCHLVRAQTLVTDAVRKYWAVLSPGLALKEPPRATHIDVPEPMLSLIHI